MMKKTYIIILLLSILLFSSTATAWSINPAKWVFYQREDYEIYPLTFDIEITNDADTPITVELSVIEPEELYPEEKVDFPGGNEKIPDKSWIDITQKRIEIPGNSKRKIPVYIDMPESYVNNNGQNISNYNKSYEVWVFADQTAGTGNIQTDYKCRWTIQTPERYVPPKERPGYVSPANMNLYLIIGTIAVFLIVGVVVVYKKDLFSKFKKKPTKPSSKRKSKRKTYDEEDDIFS